MTPDYSDPAQAHGQCAIASFAHAHEHNLGLIRVTGVSYPGREHWAIFIGSDEDLNWRVLDFTARQFDATTAFPYEADIDTWLDDVAEWLADSISYAIYASVAAHEADSPFFTDTVLRDDIDSDASPKRDGLDALLSRNS